MKKHLRSFLIAPLFLLLPLFLAAQTIPRTMVMMEIATATWCTYCPGAAMGAEDLLENYCKVAVIENHDTDPFANQYSNSRNTYYSIPGYPTAIFDGVSGVIGGNHTQSMYTSYLPKYTARINTPANIQISADITNTGLNYTANITVVKVGTVTPTDLVLHFFVTVSNITYSWQGQTHLEHVTALMVPGTSGTPVSFAGGNTQQFQLNFSLDPQWPVEDCEFIAFVQSQAVKEVYNGIKRGAIDLTPAFTASATQINNNESVTFTNQTTGGYIGVPETYQWIFPGGNPATSTDKNPVVSYAATGVYDVTLIVDRGTQIDTLVKPNYIQVGSVGIQPNANAVPSVFPNPCNGSFTVKAEGTVDLVIYSVTGNVVLDQKAVRGGSRIDSGLAPGVYFLRIMKDGKSFSEKIVIK
jgi:PKD repeat protein